MDDDAGVLARYLMLVATSWRTKGVQKVRGNCTTQPGNAGPAIGTNEILTASTFDSEENYLSIRTCSDRSLTLFNVDLPSVQSGNLIVDKGVQSANDKYSITEYLTIRNYSLL